MTELSASVLELKAELGRAIRRDHVRRQRRRSALRTGAVSLGAFAALCGTALAAGEALGVIDLGGGARAAPVATIPVWNGATGTFDNATVGPGTTTAYAYHITGGTTTTRCPFTNPPRYETDPNDIYITSTRPLTATALQQALAMNTQHSGAIWPALRADGVQSMGVFDNPIGAGCAYSTLGYSTTSNTTTQPAR